jgi:hypothetical protein
MKNLNKSEAVNYLSCIYNREQREQRRSMRVSDELQNGGNRRDGTGSQMSASRRRLSRQQRNSQHQQHNGSSSAGRVHQPSQPGDLPPGYGES